MNSNSVFSIIFILTFIGSLFSYKCFSQENDFVNRAEITIGPDAVLSAKGNVLNEGTLHNSGKIYVNNNFINQGIFNAQSGSIVIHGDTDQSIDFKKDTIHEIEVNGVGHKYFRGQVFVNNSLKLLKGIVRPDTGARLILSDAIIIEGGDEESYVEGILFHEGTTDKFYPIGINGMYSPVYLSNILGNNPVLGFEIHQPNSFTNESKELKKISTQYYWEKFIIGGNLDSATLTLNYQPDESLLPKQIQDLVVAGLDETIGFRNLGGSHEGDLTSALITSQIRISDESFFTLGIPSTDITLFIPNALSPLAPHPEDQVVKVFVNRLIPDDFHFKVFDHRGIIVFYSNSFHQMNEEGWDGINIHSGKYLSPGVYHYVIQGTVYGDKFSKAGKVTVIR
ncbi:hypothetical protein AAG747_23065 [Rapidithrix thailandica]|uniref:Gliding motility-associated C-terminal domain-containing protein n=1 Tax=Rapidithrix thailandica TaxID=413964 RepID=A0AAW9SG77_9BACT